MFDSDCAIQRLLNVYILTALVNHSCLEQFLRKYLCNLSGSRILHQGANKTFHRFLTPYYAN